MIKARYQNVFVILHAPLTATAAMIISRFAPRKQNALLIRIALQLTAFRRLAQNNHVLMENAFQQLAAMESARKEKLVIARRVFMIRIIPAKH